MVGLKGDEVQGVEGLLVSDVIGPHDQPHCSLLYPLGLVSLNGVGRG